MNLYNLYDLHKSPQSLHRYDDADMHVPVVFWDKYENDPAELKKRERAIATSAEYSYMYAADVLNGRFPPGEPVIATSARYSYWYATDVINDRFPLGEPAIATNAVYSYQYVRDVIKHRWPPGEPAIAKSAIYTQLYNNKFK